VSSGTWNKSSPQTVLCRESRFATLSGGYCRGTVAGGALGQTGKSYAGKFWELGKNA